MNKSLSVPCYSLVAAIVIVAFLSSKSFAGKNEDRKKFLEYNNNKNIVKFLQDQGAIHLGSCESPESRLVRSSLYRQLTAIKKHAFIQAVVTFIEKHRVSLDYFLDDGVLKNTNSDQVTLRGEFLSIPAIQDYLGRDIQSPSELNLVWDPNDKRGSDYYELLIYKLLNDYIPFRKNLGTSLFYESGTNNNLKNCLMLFKLKTVFFISIRQDLT